MCELFVVMSAHAYLARDATARTARVLDARPPSLYSRAVICARVIGMFCMACTCGTDAEPRREAPPVLDPDGVYLSSELADEVMPRVLPDGPSEDARHVLGEPPAGVSVDPREYVPHDVSEWYVHVTFEPDVAIDEDAAAAVFDRAWRAANDNAQVYGRDAEGPWRSVLDASVRSRLTDAPPLRRLTELHLVWALSTLTPNAARAHLAAVTSVSVRLGSASTRASIEPEETEQRARSLQALMDRFEESDVAVILTAPEGETYDGVALWDALESLGLRWGDGDFFHWENRLEGLGDDALFSVGTSTDPGYFLPEQAIAGDLQVEDLDFGFALARTHEPLAIFDAMMRAVRYVQRRLGGTILGADGDPLDEAATRARIEADARVLTEAGFAPGSDAAMSVF
jgi:cell division protein ZipA